MFLIQLFQKIFVGERFYSFLFRTLITHNGSDAVTNLTLLPKMGVDYLARVWLEYLSLSPRLSVPHSKLDAVRFGAVSVRQFSVHVYVHGCTAATINSFVCFQLAKVITRTRNNTNFT